MQVCTYLDRRFVTSLLSRPNCFSNKKKASTICYAQPVKENKSLVVRSPCPSISSSMSLWRLLLKWQQRKNHRLSISFQPQSNLVLKYILYDTFFCWQNQDLQLWKIIHVSIFLCLYFVFRACTRAHVRGLILNNFRTLVMCDCVAWDIWTQMDKNTIKQIKRKNIYFFLLIKNDDFQTLCWQEFFWLQPFNSSVGGYHPSKCIGHQKSGGNFVGARNDQPRHAKFIGWRHRSLGRQGRTRGNVITLPYILSEKKKAFYAGCSSKFNYILSSILIHFLKL